MCCLCAYSSANQARLTQTLINHTTSYQSTSLSVTLVYVLRLSMLMILLPNRALYTLLETYHSSYNTCSSGGLVWQYSYLLFTILRTLCPPRNLYISLYIRLPHRHVTTLVGICYSVTLTLWSNTGVYYLRAFHLPSQQLYISIILYLYTFYYVCLDRLTDCTLEYFNSFVIP